MIPQQAGRPGFGSLGLVGTRPGLNGLVVHLPDWQSACDGVEMVDLLVECTNSIHNVLVLWPFDQIIVTPRSQALQGLDYVITQKVPLCIYCSASPLC